MNPNESWIAEQARLLMLEDGFGPGSKSGSPSSVAMNESEAMAARSSSEQ